MNLAVTTFTILAAWRWGDWKNWKKYNSTMVYIAMCNLLYSYIYFGHFLWKIKPDILPFKISDMIFTFIIFPLTVLLLLSNYPDNIKGKIFRIAKFILIYFVVELIYIVLEKIEYNYGWNLWYSFVWLCIMFPLLILHYNKPLIAYIVSLIFVIIMLILFPVNLEIM